MNLRKRLFALLMSLTMVLTYMPALAFADSNDSASAGSGAVAGEESLVTGDANAEAATSESDAVQENEAGDQAASGLVPAGIGSGNAESNAASGTEAGNTEATADGNAEADSAANAETNAAENTAGKATGKSAPEVRLFDAGSDGAELADSDDLLMQYLEKEVAEQTGKTAGSSNMLKAARATRGSKLEGSEAALYNGLIPRVRDIAGGTSSSAVIRLPFSVLVGDDYVMTAKEFGLTHLLDENGQETDEAREASDAYFTGWEIHPIMNALLADFPYEFYWYDKTYQLVEGGEVVDSALSVSISGYENTTISDTKYTFDRDAYIEFSFKVSSDYSKTGAAGTTELDTAKTGAAAGFAENAADIIYDNAEKSDEKKLIAYRDAVCEATEYNEAAAGEDVDYGDPWQMIYVFDGDDTTNVVCEGYSKAFQFLCDNTVFDSVRIECDTVTGQMSDGTGAGDHMWNILHMDDGKNYIADITNSDENSVGGGGELFLKGAASGSVDEGYSYNTLAADGTTGYQYDADTRSTFSDSELVMSDTDYSAGSAITDVPAAISIQTAPDPEADETGPRELVGYPDADEIVNFPYSGDKLSITYNTGDDQLVKEYTFDDECWDFVCDGETLESTGYELSFICGRDGIGFAADENGYDTAAIVLERGNISVRTEVQVKVASSDIKTFEYNQAKPFVLYTDPEDGSLEDIDRYGFVQEGDTATIVYEYKYTEDDQEMVDTESHSCTAAPFNDLYGWGYTLLEGEDGYSNTPKMVTDTTGWEAGNTYDAELSIEGMRVPIKVSVQAFPYTSLVFDPVGPVELQSNMLKSTSYDGQTYLDLSKRSIKRNFFLAGDKITLRDSEGSHTYTYKTVNGVQWFADDEGKMLYRGNMFEVHTSGGKAVIGQNDALIRYIFADSNEFKVTITEGGDEHFVINSDGMDLDAFHGSDGFTYTAAKSGDGYAIIGYDCKDAQMKVPAVINGYPVTEFLIDPRNPIDGDGDFSKITSIDFQNNETLDRFYYGNLETMDNLASISNLASDKYRIQDNALYTEYTDEDGNPVDPYVSLAFYPPECKASTLTVDDNTRAVQYMALAGNKYLKKIVLSPVTDMVDWYAFEDCSALEEVEFTAKSAPEPSQEDRYDRFSGLRQAYFNFGTDITYPADGTGYEEFLREIRTLGYGPFPEDPADIIELKAGSQTDFSLAEGEVKTIHFAPGEAGEYYCNLSSDETGSVDICHIYKQQLYWYDYVSGMSIQGQQLNLTVYEPDEEYWMQIRSSDGKAISGITFNVQKRVYPEVEISDLSIEKTTVGKGEENTGSFHVVSPEGRKISSISVDFISDQEAYLSPSSCDYSYGSSETDVTFKVTSKAYGLWSAYRIWVNFEDGTNAEVLDKDYERQYDNNFGQYKFIDMSAMDFAVVRDPDQPEDTQAPVISGPYAANPKSVPLYSTVEISFNVSDEELYMVEIYFVNQDGNSYGQTIYPDDSNYRDGVLTVPYNTYEKGSYSVVRIVAYDSSYNSAVLFNSACSEATHYEEYDPEIAEDMSGADFTVTESEHRHELVFTDNTQPTCTEPGCTAHYTCSVCGKYFSDAEGLNEITEDSWMLPALGHQTETTPAVDPTCEEPGYTEGITCSRCGEVITERTEIPALGHDWSIEYIWSEDGSTCSASAVCRRNMDHSFVEPGTVTEEVTKEPTATEAGSKTLIAVFTNELFEAQTRTVEIPPTGSQESVRPTDVSEPAEGNALVKFPGEFKYESSADILAKINALRLEACEEGVPDPRNSSRNLTASDYVPIKWSSDLEWIAQTRAAEATLYQGHTRPNGTSCFTTTHNGVQSYGECLAFNGSANIMYGIDQWYEEKSDWVNKTEGAVTGHYTALINPANTYVGIGAFSNEDCYYGAVAGEFTSVSGLDEAQSGSSGAVSQIIEVKSSELSVSAETPVSVHEGKQAQLSLNATVTAGGEAAVPVRLMSDTEWTSRDTDTARVDKNGKVTGVKAGSCQVIASAGGTEYTIDVTVTGHTAGETVTENAKAATCTEAGSHDEVVYCTVCNEEISREHITDPALGHKPGETVHENVKAATCTEAGSHDEVVYCTICNEEISREHITDPALGHKPGDTVTENAKAATCTEAGSHDEVVYCTVCNEVVSRSTVTDPALGHKWGTPEYTWADDNSSVSAKAVCTNDKTHVEEETAATTYTVVTEPTETQAGLGRYTAAFTNSLFETQTRDVEIPPTIHVHTMKEVAAKAATCTTEGNIAYWVCSGCGKYFKDAEGENEISEADTVIAKTAHTPGQAVTENVTAPTCTEAGSHDEVVYCTVCHEEISRTPVTDPAAGHSWNDPEYEWIKDGYGYKVTARMTCKNGDHPVTETVNATETGRQDATYDAAGWVSYEAEFTNEAFTKQTKTDEIPQLVHTPEEALETAKAKNAEVNDQSSAANKGAETALAEAEDINVDGLSAEEAAQKIQAAEQKAKDAEAAAAAANEAADAAISAAQLALSMAQEAYGDSTDPDEQKTLQDAKDALAAATRIKAAASRSLASAKRATAKAASKAAEAAKKAAENASPEDAVEAANAAQAAAEKAEELAGEAKSAAEAASQNAAAAVEAAKDASDAEKDAAAAESQAANAVASNTDAEEKAAAEAAEQARKAAENAAKKKNAEDKAGEAAAKAAEAESKAQAAESAVNALKEAAAAAKTAADKAAQTLSQEDIDAANKAVTDAKEKQSAADAAIAAANAAKQAADTAVQAANEAIAAAGDADVSAASQTAANAAAKTSAAGTAVGTAQTEKAGADSDLTTADTTAGKAASDKAEADKKAEEAAAAKKAAEAAAQAAEAARQGVLDPKMPKISISKPKAAKKAVTVKWKKIAAKKLKKAQKIEVWVCPNKAFRAADTKISTVGKKKSSAKVKGLKSKTKYYIKVRTIRYAGGVKYVSKWSKVKSIKVK